MRVSAGIAKGTNLISPKIPGIRLTQEIARQAVFSILGDKIKKAFCLDLYAGSGSIGIEALSRGAAECDFVDINDEAIKAIKENLKHCRFELSGETFREDSLKFASSAGKKYDLIFMDPYYDQVAHKHIFKVLPEIMDEMAEVIFFHGKDLDANETISQSGLKIIDSRKYGSTHISFLTKK